MELGGERLLQLWQDVNKSLANIKPLGAIQNLKMKTKRELLHAMLRHCRIATDANASADMHYG